jgi:NADPH:quinone reductase-like Zn-dependent oxidoreductase
MRQLLQPSIYSPSLILTTAPVPSVSSSPDSVLVRVAACCPCAGELSWAANFPGAVPAEKEMVPCQDLAGTIVALPPGGGETTTSASTTAGELGSFKVGDRVFCRVSAERAGTAREYAVAKLSELAKIPDGLGWLDAAATPLSALTAWQGLFVHGGLEVGGLNGDEAARKRNGEKRVLITGAVGGVGSWAVQLAALAGAGAVVAVCGRGKADSARKLGATEVVDYTQTSVEEWTAADPAGKRQVDLVFDVVGGKTLAGCWHAVKEGGALVGVNTPPDAVRPAGLEKTVAKSLFFIVEPLGSNLTQVAELIAAGKVRPSVDSVWKLDEFEKAFERVEGGHASGKIVIKVAEDDN